MAKTYDTKCYELAKVFIDDHNLAMSKDFIRTVPSGLYEELAKEIQQTIEDFLDNR